MKVEAPKASNDVVEFVFGSNDPMPLSELAQSFLAVDLNRPGFVGGSNS